ncbi:hypothetical protein C1J03_16760 [Sulfitobacter sp. SK012]|nr:hypothetical protein C1J03_16760 [Sulfitobacter sp. SK012]
MERLAKRVSVLGCAAVLGACTLGSLTGEPVLTPVARPAGLGNTAAPVVAKPTSEASAQLRSYLNQVQSAQLSQGLLRRDGGGEDTPFTATTLARNFEKIAFYNEYDGNFSGRGGKSPLRRWETPVRMQVIYGAGVPPSERKRASADVSAYAARLSRITRHPISTGGRPNFAVIIAGEDDRAEALAEAAALVPGITENSLKALRNMPRDTYCVVAAFAGGPDANTYTAAVAVIRAENPSLLRLSCIHEELAQGLGLANDSPAARPSIFNDDDEFALLTDHDAMLLQMLYDPRLSPGMSASEAAATVLEISRELTGGPA